MFFQKSNLFLKLIASDLCHPYLFSVELLNLLDGFDVDLLVFRYKRLDRMVYLVNQLGHVPCDFGAEIG